MNKNLRKSFSQPTIDPSATIDEVVFEAEQKWEEAYTSAGFKGDLDLRKDYDRRCLFSVRRSEENTRPGFIASWIKDNIWAAGMVFMIHARDSQDSQLDSMVKVLSAPNAVQELLMDNLGHDRERLHGVEISYFKRISERLTPNQREKIAADGNNRCAILTAENSELLKLYPEEQGPETQSSPAPAPN